MAYGLWHEGSPSGLTVAYGLWPVAYGTTASGSWFKAHGSKLARRNHQLVSLIQLTLV
jgi:hypothetical protein